MLWYCRITEVIEREVVVDAPGERMARQMAVRPADWLDRGAATTVAVEVEHVAPQVEEVDPLVAAKHKAEG